MLQQKGLARVAETDPDDRRSGLSDGSHSREISILGNDNGAPFRRERPNDPVVDIGRRHQCDMIRLKSQLPKRRDQCHRQVGVDDE